MSVANPASSATIHRVVVSLTSAQTLAYERANRVGCVIYNNSTADLYVLLQNNPGTAVSASNASYKIASQGALEVPYGYTGEIHGVWASANGTAQVTEFI